MKKQNFVFSKKFMPPNAQRVTKADGRRVWIINGKEFANKREYFVWLSQRSQPEPEKPKTPETKVCGCETPKPQELVPEWCQTCGGKIMPNPEPKIPEFGTSIPFDPPLPVTEDLL